MGWCTHVVLLESEGSTEVGAQAALGVAVNLLPRGAVLKHTLQRNVVALLPRRARVVHVAAAPSASVFCTFALVKQVN